MSDIDTCLFFYDTDDASVSCTLSSVGNSSNYSDNYDLDPDWDPDSFYYEYDSSETWETGQVKQYFDIKVLTGEKCWCCGADLPRQQKKVNRLCRTQSLSKISCNLKKVK